MTSDSSSPHARRRVLLAEASASDCESMKKALQSWGLEVDTASTGVEVLGLVRANTYALIYLDTALPVMSGLKTWEILRADTRFQALPILLAGTQAEIPGNRDADPALTFLEKPVTPTILLGELGRHFDPVSFESFISVSPVAAAQRETPRSVQMQQDAQEATSRAQKGSPSMQTSSSNTVEQDHLLKLPGFDCVSGLKRVMGNRTLYTRLLRDFQNVLLEARTSIRTLREENDIQGLEAAVHKIKGISGNLAADVLYKESVRLDDHLKELDPVAGTLPNSQLDAFLLSIETTLTALSAITPSGAPDTAKTTPPPTESTQQLEKIGQITDVLRETLVLLRQSNTSAREAFAHGIELFEGTHTSELTEIGNLIDMFDFEGADRHIMTLAASLGIEIEVSHELQ